MANKVVKFGGSSLADAEQFRKVADIIKSDEKRKYVVPSAPGKRFSDDINLIICKTIGKADIVKMPIDEYRDLITG